MITTEATTPKKGSADSQAVVVIGGGIHGLATAALLAKTGKKVLVLERRTVLGGMYSAQEILPGFMTAGLVPVVDKLAGQLVKELALQKHGLMLATGPQNFGIATLGGGALRLSSDLEAASGMLRKTMPLDAEGLLKIHGFLGRIRSLFQKVIVGPQINLIDMAAPNLWELLPKALGLRMLGKRDMFDVIRLLPMCLADFLSESLPNDLLKGGLAGQALSGTFLGPWSPGSTTNFLLNQLATGPRILGGGPALVRALEAATNALGVEVRTNAAVSEIVVEAGKVTAVQLESGQRIPTSQVFSSVDGHSTLTKMLPPRALTMKTQHRLRSFRIRGTAAIAHFALNGLPPFKNSELNGLSSIICADHVDTVEKAFDPVKYREIPTHPMLHITIPTLDRAGTAPEGNHVMTVTASFVPTHPKGGWTEAVKQNFLGVILHQLEALAPGFASKILKSVLLSPQDLEQQYGLTGGQLHHGEMSLDQIFMRPTPECTSGRTPVQGLFLCGMGMQPVGGMIGPPAINAVREFLR